MVRVRIPFLLFAILLLFPAAAGATGPEVGQPAPAFAGTDTHGHVHRLADYAGRTVVLEWTNHLCPYTAKHYSTGNMQALQKTAAADGVVWLSVVSSAPGRQGHVTAAEADQLTASRGAAPAAVILDPKGTMGWAYGARTTPHMYIIDATGMLRYRGAIDDVPTANPHDVNIAYNYVQAALGEIKAGKSVSIPITQPYGCTVKYR